MQRTGDTPIAPSTPTSAVAGATDLPPWPWEVIKDDNSDRGLWMVLGAPRPGTIGREIIARDINQVTALKIVELVNENCKPPPLPELSEALTDRICHCKSYGDCRRMAVPIAAAVDWIKTDMGFAAPETYRDRSQRWIHRIEEALRGDLRADSDTSG